MNNDNSQPTGDEPIETLDDEVEEDPESSESDDAVESTSESAPVDEMDIDAALAAVSQLSLLAEVTEDQDSDIDEPLDDSEIADGDYQSVEHEPEHIEPIHESDFELPRQLTMTRGQLSSVIPAFALIAIGGWLTFTLTTSTVAPSSGLLFAIAVLVIGLVFLAQWLNSGRWSRGNFFFGTATLLIGGVQLYLSQMLPAEMSSGWSLWIVAIGIALFGAGYMTLPRLPRVSIMGMLIIVAGAIAYLMTSGTIDPTIINFISNLWFVGVAIIIFMIIAPFVRRRS